MAKFHIFDAPIYPHYEKLIEFNKSERSKPENIDFNASLNLNIILSSACMVEGILEDRGKLLLGYYRVIFSQIEVTEFELRKPINQFYNNVEKQLHTRVSQTTGLENFANLFESLTGKSLKSDSQIKTVYEGINTLFQLRNVIAHGRVIHAFTVDAYYTNGVEENFLGGYKKAENYLIKKGLLSKRFLDVERNDLYFSDEIADHFNAIANDFVRFLDGYIYNSLIIDDIIQKSFEQFNEGRVTKYTIMEFLRNMGTCA